MASPVRVASGELTLMAEPQWEYTEVVILLNLACPYDADRATQAQFVQQYDAIVRGYLQREAEQGWQPAEPVDAETMRAAGRLPRVEEGLQFRFESVRVLLRRPAQLQPSPSSQPHQ